MVCILSQMERDVPAFACGDDLRGFRPWIGGAVKNDCAAGWIVCRELIKCRQNGSVQNAAHCQIKLFRACEGRNGSDALADKDDVVIRAEVDIAQKFYGLIQRDKKALAHFLRVAPDILRKAGIGHRHDFISKFLHHPAGIVEKGPVAGVSDAGEKACNAGLLLQTGGYGAGKRIVFCHGKPPAGQMDQTDQMDLTDQTDLTDQSDGSDGSDRAARAGHRFFVPVYIRYLFG